MMLQSLFRIFKEFWATLECSACATVQAPETHIATYELLQSLNSRCITLRLDHSNLELGKRHLEFRSLPTP